MVEWVSGDIFNERQVDSIDYDAPADLFTMHTRDLVSNEKTTLLTRRLIMATGRFGPLSTSLQGLTQYHSLRRLEVGFRIEQASEKAFFRDMKQLDPKLCFKQADGSTEWRNFGACRQGEAVLTQTERLWTVSGRSHCLHTGRSNSGFNTRILAESLAAQVALPVIKAMSNVKSFFNVPMTSLLKNAITFIHRLSRIDHCKPKAGVF